MKYLIIIFINDFRETCKETKIENHFKIIQIKYFFLWILLSHLRNMINYKDFILE